MLSENTDQNQDKNISILTKHELSKICLKMCFMGINKFEIVFNYTLNHQNDIVIDLNTYLQFQVQLFFISLY
jgi:hypothetical protein